MPESVLILIDRSMRKARNLSLPNFGLRPRCALISQKGCNMLNFRKRNDKAEGAPSPCGIRVLEGRVVLSTFHVNTFADTVAVNLHTGRDSTGHVSLRSAIMAADANPNSSDTIVLPAGTYNLTIAPTGNDGTSSGDLDIVVNNKLTIKGSTKGPDNHQWQQSRPGVLHVERQCLDFERCDRARSSRWPGRHARAGRRALE